MFFPLFVSLALLAPPVARVTVSAPRDTVSPGDTIVLRATLTGTNGRAASTATYPISWGVSAPAVASLVAPTSATVRLVARAAGTVAATALADGVTGTRVIVVRAVPPPPPVVVTNAPPTARFTGLCALLACTVDGRGSSDDHGIARYTWTFGDSGTVTIDGATAAYTWSSPGTYRVSLRVVDSAGLAATLTQTLTATAPVVPPVVPPVVVVVDTSPTVVVVTDTSRTPHLPLLLDTRAPAITGRTLVVGATGSLQAALDSAKAGDVITLVNGATYTGPFTLPAKAGMTPTSGGWITIRPAVTTALPPEGTRLIPAKLAAGTLPRLLAPDAMPVLATAAGAAGYRLIGLELGVAPGVAMNYGLVVFGTGNETALAQYPGRLVIDRSYLHGGPTLELKRAVSLNSTATAVIDSYISEIHGAGSFSETQGLLGWNGPGPFKITNNYIEAGGVSVMFGGASDPNIPGLIPSDIEIRGNHVRKPLEWIALGYTNKNSLELKDAQRVLVEGNVFENNWAQSQAGLMVQFTAVSQSGTANWITVRDVTFRHNVLRNSPQGLGLSSRYAPTGGLLITEPTRRVLISDNVFDQVGPGNLFQLGGDHDAVTIAHNTALAPVNSFMMLLGGYGPATRFAVTDNAFAHGLYGLFGDNVGSGTPALTTYAPGATWSGNAIVSPSWYTSTYPAATTWLLPGAAVPAGVGADTAAVRAATAGVVVP